MDVTSDSASASAGSSAAALTNPAVVSTSNVNTGLSITLHPLPILNISEHWTRNQFEHGGRQKAIGALLGTQSGREVSIVNSFELLVLPSSTPGGDSAVGGDVDMDSGSRSEPKKMSGKGKWKIDEEFLERRRAQYKETFPSQEMVGWYSTGDDPDAEDIILQHELGNVLETPLFLLFSDPSRTSGSGSTLPIQIYESTLGADNVTGVSSSSSSEGHLGDGRPGLVQLEYKVETGEAERIAVDGAAKSGDSMGESGSTLVASLTTQRNAIKMMHDRMSILLEYVAGVINGTSKPDYSVLREIGALVSTLPAMTAPGFTEEFMTEYNDVQLTAYLASLTKSLATLDNLTDKFNAIYHADDRGVGGAGMGLMAGLGPGKRSGFGGFRGGGMRVGAGGGGGGDAGGRGAKGVRG